MPINEKEYNGFLFDQLSLIEEIEEAVEGGNIEEIKKLLAKKRKQVERKLYQNPSITDGK